MRRRVPEHLEALGGVLCNYLEVSPAIQRGFEIDEFSVQLRNHRVSGEASTYLLGDVAGLLARSYLQLFAVG
jgi:hypothetical protein